MQSDASTSAERGPLDQAATALRVATEELTEELAAEAAPERLAAAQDRRDSAFLRLRALASGGESLGDSGRRELALVRELDAELIGLASVLSQAVQGERRAVARRRRAIRAHAQREREAPRALTVKA